MDYTNESNLCFRSFASGVQQVVKSIKAKSKGMLSELIWCINHRVPMFLAYKSANGLGIYTAEIDDNLTFKGIADPLDFLNVEQLKSYFY